MACFSYFPLSVANYSPVRFRVNIYVRSLCRAAGVLESQESGGRARASCSQRRRRQAEFEVLGSGDAVAATPGAPTPTWLGLHCFFSTQLPRLPFRHVQLSSTGAALPLLLRHGDLTKCRWNPGFLLRLLLQSCWGVHPPLSLWRQGDHLRGFFRRGRASTATRPLLFLRPRPELLPGGFRASHAGRPLQLRARSRRRRSPWSQPPRRRVGWSFSIAGASSRRLRLPRSIGC